MLFKNSLKLLTPRTLTSTSRSTLLVEPPDEVVPQPEDFFVVMIIIIIVNNTILNTITNKENKICTCDCGHPLVIVSSPSAWQAGRSDVLGRGPVQLFRENNDFCHFMTEAPFWPSWAERSPDRQCCCRNPRAWWSRRCPSSSSRWISSIIWRLVSWWLWKLKLWRIWTAASWWIWKTKIWKVFSSWFKFPCSPSMIHQSPSSHVRQEAPVDTLLILSYAKKVNVLISFTCCFYGDN